ncbi:MAG: hydrogenase nickel incorporation protein HypB [Candidatus Obscuribacterales bacterium]
MCTTCGCSDDAAAKITNMQSEKHDHSHEHDHHHEHPHSHEHEHIHDHDHHDHSHSHAAKSSTITLEEKILAKNDRLAERNRGWFEGSDILALNLVSSPGAGKTALLERTILDLKEQIDIVVMEGDQATTNDAERIKKAGCPVLQINTGAGCHLDAEMIASALKELKPAQGSLLFIENVGNLVCPALFDLGEKHKVVILSVTEGEDKPVKYPHMFRAAELMILNKTDLLPYLNFDLEACKKYALSVNPHLKIIEVSVTKGTGLDTWYSWLKEQSQERI